MRNPCIANRLNREDEESYKILVTFMRQVLKIKGINSSKNVKDNLNDWYEISSSDLNCGLKMTIRKSSKIISKEGLKMVIRK